MLLLGSGTLSSVISNERQSKCSSTALKKKELKGLAGRIRGGIPFRALCPSTNEGTYFLLIIWPPLRDRPVKT